MKVAELTNVLNQLKQQAPQYDYGMFTLKINGEDISNVSVSIEEFAINLSPADSGELAAAELGGEDGEETLDTTGSD